MSKQSGQSSLAAWLVVLGVAATAAGAGADAKDKAAPPAAVEAVTRCRTIADDAARLHCFDTSAQQLQAAIAKRDVYVLERTEVRQTRRELFGLSVAKESVISESVDDENKVDEIDATVTAAAQDNLGNWTVTLNTGAVWQQTDGYPLARGPRKGDTVEIKRAAMGSYKMSVGKQSAVRVRRLR